MRRRAARGSGYNEELDLSEIEPIASRLTPRAWLLAPLASRPLPRASRPERSDHGFTILELMIVMTIAGILVTLAEPSFRHSVVNAREAALKQDLFTMRDAIDQFRADRGKYPGGLLELKDVGYLRRIPVDPFTRSDGTWQEIQAQDEGGVFDVHSGSDLVGLDGTPYNYW